MSGEAFQVAHEVDRFLALIHPKCLNQAVPHIARIEEHFGLVAETQATWQYPNSERAREEFHAQIAPKLGKTTLITVWSGDGGANQISNFLCDPEISDAAREAPIFSDGRGRGACDTTRSLHNPRLLRDPLKVLTSPNLQTAKIYPVHANFPTPNGQRNQIVNSYFGAGTSAAGAVNINTTKPVLEALIARRPRVGPVVQKAREPGIVLAPACISPTFELLEIDDPQHPQRTENVMEFLIGNSSRFARYGLLWTDLRSTEIGVATAQTRVTGNWRAPHVVYDGLRLTQGRLPAEIYDMSHGSRSWEIQNIDRRPNGPPLYVQWDGETDEICEGTVTISAAKALTVLTTQPHFNQGK